MKFATPVALALTSFLVACGSTDHDANQGAANGTGGGSNVGGDGNSGGDGNGSGGSGPEGACNLNSGFEGDDLCIPPPSPDEGIQIHVGPTSYDDPDAIAPYLLDAGDENVRCYNAKLPQSDFYYLKQQNRMRSHSHHMLIFVAKATGLTEGPTAACDITGGLASIPGSQTPARDFPDQLGPEDAGIGRYLPQADMATFQLHYVNTTTEPVLREAWVNIYKKPKEEVTTPLQSIFLVGDLTVNIPAHTQQTTTLEFSPNLPGETRIFAMNGHMHAHTERFTVWRERGTDSEQIYQSFDWQEPAELTFNTVVQNPVANEATKIDGGISGMFTLMPGDKLKWSCDVNNTLDTAIHFANEAETAEMCLLAGAYIGTPGLMAGACAAGQCSAGFGLGGR
ncbi:MAG TPA: hypothetical protein VHE30_23695 [Polyangiaceae bacterium]|nr:hypothetical protein [Polyangiaceae bacterium]